MVRLNPRDRQSISHATGASSARDSGVSVNTREDRLKKAQCGHLGGVITELEEAEGGGEEGTATIGTVHRHAG